MRNKVKTQAIKQDDDGDDGDFSLPEIEWNFIDNS